MNRMSTLITSQLHMTHWHESSRRDHRSRRGTAVGTASDSLSKAKFFKTGLRFVCGTHLLRLVFQSIPPAQRLDGAAWTSEMSFLEGE